MLSLNDLPIEKKLASEIERRRILEEQRKLRIFNPRQRIIGLDLPTLEKQCILNAQKREEELQRQKQMDSLILNNDRKAWDLQQAQNAERRRIERDIAEFWQQCQMPCTRREFDINDPNLLKKEIPPRVSDSDPRCSISGCQMLIGEDVDYPRRKKIQQQQQREWLLEQMEENRRKRAQECEKERLWQAKLLELDCKAVELDRSEKDTLRAEAVARTEFNRRLNVEQKQRHCEEMRMAEQKSLQEIFNNFYGDMLTENPKCARSSFGPHRVVPDRWKGFTPEMKAEYNRHLREQIGIDKNTRAEENRKEAGYQNLLLGLDRKAVLIDRELARERRCLNKSIAHENALLQEEQARLKNYLNCELGINALSPEYFNQFNTTTR